MSKERIHATGGEPARVPLLCPWWQLRRHWATIDGANPPQAVFEVEGVLMQHARVEVERAAALLAERHLLGPCSALAEDVWLLY